MAKLIVTITPPTPNGDLHIGHLAGPFLAADVYARVQRQQGHDCLLICYSDDYQSYMIRKGLELDRNPAVLAKENTAEIGATLKAANIDITHWMSTYGNPYFLDAAREVYEAGTRKGTIHSRRSKEPYCPKCRTWGYEAFGRGACNYCGTDSDASQCEKCGYPPDAARMEGFRCKLCGGSFLWPEVERQFLDVAAYHDYLRNLYLRIPIRPPLASWVSSVLTAGPREWGLTRPEEAGLDLSGDGSCKLHTWFLGLSGYIAAVREYAEEVIKEPQLFEEYWKRDDARLVLFLGHDCAYSHMVVYPALLSNLDGDNPKPQFYPNQFLKLNGENLSTSRNHVIWAKDLISDFDADSVRLYLASIAPEEAESDFQVATFRHWHQTIFVETIDALIDCTRRERAAGSSPNLGADDRALVTRFQERWRSAASLDHFSMRSIAQIVLDLVAIGRDRMVLGKPVAHIVEMIGVLGEALHPALSERLATAAVPKSMEEQRLSLRSAGT